MSRSLGNRKVAKKRGSEWRAKLSQGKFESRFNPTGVQLARLRNRLSQQEIAKKAGISNASYGSIERAKRYVSHARAEEIAKILRTEVTKIFKPVKKKKFVAFAALGNSRVAAR